MAPCRCVVSFTDPDGILHEVEVHASSVYDAVGTAMRELSQDGIAETKPGALTEFTVLVHRAPLRHRLKLEQVIRWARGAGKSPAELLQRKYVRKLLKLEDGE